MHETIKGTVSGMQQRMEPRVGAPAVLVWDFRLERQGVDGNPLPRVSIEMRGISFAGSIINGDVIELEGDPNDLIMTDRVRNLTARTTVAVTNDGNGSAATRSAVPVQKSGPGGFVVILGLVLGVIVVFMMYVMAR